MGKKITFGILIFLFSLRFSIVYAATTCDPAKYDPAGNHPVTTTDKCPGGTGKCNGTDPVCPAGECQNGDVSSFVQLGVETRTVWCWPPRTTSGNLTCGASCNPNANQCSGQCSDCKNPGNGYICVPPPNNANDTIAPPAPPNPCNNGDGDFTSCNTALGKLAATPGNFITSAYTSILSMAGGIAVLLIIMSGYTMITSQGNPERVKAAQERLTAAIVGLLFIIFSFVILETIGVDILGLPGLTK